MARRGYVDKRGNKRQYSMIPFVGLGILVVLLIVIIVGITSCAKGCSNKGDTNETKPQTTTTAKATESSFNMSIAGDYIIFIVQFIKVQMNLPVATDITLNQWLRT